MAWHGRQVERNPTPVPPVLGCFASAKQRTGGCAGSRDVFIDRRCVWVSVSLPSSSHPATASSNPCSTVRFIPFVYFSFPNSSRHPIVSLIIEWIFARSCLHRLPARLPTFHGSSLYPRLMPFRICTTRHLSTMNFVPISLPICSISSTFSAAFRIGSTFPSPEQLSISGRFCRVTTHPHFPGNGF